MSVKRKLFSKKLSKTIALAVMSMGLMGITSVADAHSEFVNSNYEKFTGTVLDMTTIDSYTIAPNIAMTKRPITYAKGFVCNYRYDKETDTVIGGTMTPLYGKTASATSSNWIDMVIPASDLAGLSDLEVNHVLEKLGEKYVNTIETSSWANSSACWANVYLHIVDENNRSLRVGKLEWDSTFLKTKFSYIRFAQAFTTVENNTTNDLNVLATRIKLAPDGEGAKGVYAENSGSDASNILISNTEASSIVADGNAVEAGKNGVININGRKLMTVESKNGYALYARDGGVINADLLEITGGDVYAEKGGSIKLSVDNMNANVKADADSEIKLSVDKQLTGNVDGNVSVNIAKAATWQGHSKNDASLNLAGSWNVTGDSQLTKFNGTEGSKISLGDSSLSINSYAGDTTIESNSSGNTITVNQAEAGSKLAMNSAATGTYTEAELKALLQGMANGIYYKDSINGASELAASVALSSKLEDDVDKLNKANVVYDKTTGQGSIEDIFTELGMPEEYNKDIDGTYPATFKGGSTWNGAGVDGAQVALGDGTEWNPGANASDFTKLSAGEKTAATINVGAGDINIGLYEGISDVNYANDGTAIAGGNISIGSAAENAQINLMAGNAKVDDVDDKAKATELLGNLAQKLTFKDTDGSGNLQASAGIALDQENGIWNREYEGKVVFDKTTGVGNITDVNSSKLKGEDTMHDGITTIQIRGDLEKDKEYAKYASVDENGKLKYTFTEDLSLTLNSSGQGNRDGEPIPPADKDHPYVGQIYTSIINNNGKFNDYTQSLSDEINSYTIDLQNHDLNLDYNCPAGFEGYQTHVIGILTPREGDLVIDNPGKITIEVGGPQVYYSAGLRSSTGAPNKLGGAHLIINNDNTWEHAVEIKAEGTNAWKLISFAQIEGSEGMREGEHYGNTIDVKGLVKIDSTGGIGLFAYTNDCKVSVGGGLIKDSTAIWAGASHNDFIGNIPEVNVNVIRDENGKVIGAGNNPVMIEGVINATNYYDMGTGGGRVNLALTTPDSYMKSKVNKGAIDSEVNLWLKNGATWELRGSSPITKFSGTDGIIKPGAYTVNIESAEAGSNVNVVAEDGKLNDVAGKFYYTAYVDGEENLSAKAVIEGEAARESAEILYNKDNNGQGYIDENKATDTEIFGEFNESINKNTNVTVTETGTWAPTGESSVPSLKGEAGSAVDMSNAASLNVDNYSGETTMLYGHDESDPTQIKGGNVNIGSAEEGSKVTMSTDNNGINTEDNKQVAAVMNAMAQKLTYAEAAETADNTPANNLSGKVQIAEGLTASSASIAVGDIKFDKEGKGSVDESTIENSAQKGDKETATMKAVKGALVSGALMMRAESNDLLKRMGDVRLAQEDRGLWAKYYGGKYELDSANAHLSYKAYQLGYDTKAGKNWTVGGAVSYNEGKDGRTELKNTAVGVYGTWTDDKGQYIDLITKIGWLKNDFDVKAAGHDVDDSLKTTGMSLSAEYGKRFENKSGFFVDPSAELTFGHLNGKKVNAKADGGSTTLGIDQDDFNSLVGRLGIRIGQKSAKSSVYAKVALAHEFCGDMDITFSAPSEPTKKVSVDMKDTWGEFQIGGTTKIGKAGMLYANYQRSFAGDVKEKYRVDAGLRWSF